MDNENSHSVSVVSIVASGGTIVADPPNKSETTTPRAITRVANLRVILSSEQNGNADQNEANRHHHRPRPESVSPGILRPFLSNQKEHDQKKKIGRASCRERV